MVHWYIPKTRKGTRGRNIWRWRKEEEKEGKSRCDLGRGVGRRRKRRKRNEIKEGRRENSGGGGGSIPKITGAWQRTSDNRWLTDSSRMVKRLANTSPKPATDELNIYIFNRSDRIIQNGGLHDTCHPFRAGPVKTAFYTCTSYLSLCIV